MRAPDFWYRRPGPVSWILAPLGWLYAAATAHRLRRGRAVRPGVPVICVGNLNAGGSGKTPVAIALAQRLRDRGASPAILTRGYGGRLTGPHLVDERNDRAGTVGDEPLLIAAFAPTWVARDRIAGARAAMAAGADALIMDDGFQNPDLHQDLAVVVVDAARGFGNRRCIPAGPLREPTAAGLARADILLSVGSDEDQERFRQSTTVPGSLPHLTACLMPLETGMDWKGLRVVAFAGIGHPEKFFATLRGLGAEVAESHALADHQPLDARLIGRLSGRARALRARLVTTEKDAVRLPQEMRTEVLTLPVRLQLDDWRPLDAALARLGL